MPTATGALKMESFVDREAELMLIDEAFGALLDKKLLLRTPIIEFHGVRGIGKTAVLKNVQQRCNDRNLPHIWVDASYDIPKFSHEIIEQVERYSIQFMHKNSDEDLLNLSISATKALLKKKGQAVLLLDSLDAASEEQLSWIEAMLRDLIEDNKLFVVLASKRVMTFDRERSIARKLTPVALKPLNWNSCELYLKRNASQIEPEVRNIIFDWTHGYPLAMDVMIQTILRKGLDPRKKDEQKQLLSVIIEQVINQGVLSNVEQTQTELEWYQTILSLLSVPRRFNLVIMQEIIEQFAPQYALESSLAYIGWPKRINQTTDVMSWNMLRAGFSVDKPVRDIFLLKLRIEQNKTYCTIHNFLAQINKRFAEEVSGSDRVRYLREYLYHSANCGGVADLPQILEQTVRQIILESPESFLQFKEEFSQDEELKEALGSQVNIALSLFHKNLAEMNRRFASEASGLDRVRYLREFFFHIIQDPEITTHPLILNQNIRRVIEEEHPNVSLKLFEELLRDDKFRELLSEDINQLQSLIRNKSKQGLEG